MGYDVDGDAVLVVLMLMRVVVIMLVMGVVGDDDCIISAFSDLL